MFGGVLLKRPTWILSLALAALLAAGCARGAAQPQAPEAPPFTSRVEAGPAPTEAEDAVPAAAAQEVSASTEELTAGAETIAQSTQRLAGMSRELLSRVGRFRY